MKRACIVWLIVLLVLEAGALGEGSDIALTEPLYEGMKVVILTVGAETGGELRVNIFADEEALAESAVRNEAGDVVVTLSRALRTGERIKVRTEAETEVWAEFTVGDRFGPRLPRLRDRIDGMFAQWKDVWLPAFLEGRVYLRVRFDELPCVAYPDEAPEMTVEETVDGARIWLSEPVSDGWRVQAASGLPVELTPCEWDDLWGCYTCEGGFDSVYLTLDQREEGPSVTVVYERGKGFLASWPVVEWIEGDEDDALAFNVYGFGTSREFNGGMYAIVGPESAWYAEYDIEHALSGYVDLMSERAYDRDGNLISGEETAPECTNVEIW